MSTRICWLPIVLLVAWICGFRTIDNKLRSAFEIGNATYKRYNSLRSINLEKCENDSNSQVQPIVAIVGRPNVGKSALFNRISNQFHRGSIVSEIPGTTRDRQYALADWGGHGFRLVDTGGFEECGPYADEIKTQIKQSIGEASVVIVVVDGQVGITYDDLKLRDVLFEALNDHPKLKIILCVNKCESHRLGNVLSEQFWSLGFGKPYAVSALHGSGIGDLLDKCTEAFDGTIAQEQNDIVISFVGRPNSGKSSLINRLVGTDRCIVSPNEGTTLDTVDVPVLRDGKRYLLIDTAGMRLVTKDRRSFLPQNRSKRAIRRSDVCILVLDANWGISRSDLKMAEEIRAEGKAAVVVCNKWDLIDKDPTVYKNAVAYVKEKLHSLSYAEILLISAKSGQRVDLVLESAANAFEQYSKTFSTAILNELLREATFMQKPPATHGKRLNIYYCCQVHTKPPGIAIFCNDELLVTSDYEEYLELFFRRSLSLTGTPIKWYLRKRRRRNMVPDLRKRDRTKYDPNNLLIL